MTETQAHHEEVGLMQELRAMPALSRPMNPRAWSWMPFLALALVALGGSAFWFGFLDAGSRRPALEIGTAMAIAVLGFGMVLLIRLMQQTGGSVLHDMIATTLGLLSMAVGVIHLAVIQQHIQIYWAYGWFFVVVGAAQLLWALLVVVWPSRLILWAGAAGNLLIAGTWVMTRTYGDLIGPSATMPEKIGFAD